MGASQVNSGPGSCVGYHGGNNGNNTGGFNVGDNKDGGAGKKGPESDELHERLAVLDFQAGAEAESLDDAHESVMAGLDKLEQDGYDVGDLKELAENLHKEGNIEGLKTMSEGLAEEVENGGIDSRIPGDEGQCGEGESGGDELLENLAANDFQQSADADTAQESYDALLAGLDKLEEAGYDVSDVRELAEEAFEDRDLEALQTIGSTLGEEIENGTIENRLPEDDDMSGNSTGDS